MRYPQASPIALVFTIPALATVLLHWMIRQGLDAVLVVEEGAWGGVLYVGR